MFKKQVRSSQNLVEKMMGGEKEVRKLEESHELVNEKLVNVTDVCNSLTNSLVANTETLFAVADRVSEEEYSLALQVLDASKLQLFQFLKSKEILEAYSNEIKEILKRIEVSKKVEENVLRVESFLSDRKSFSALPTGFTNELEDISRSSKAVVHSVNALVDLKVGKI